MQDEVFVEASFTQQEQQCGQQLHGTWGCCITPVANRLATRDVTLREIIEQARVDASW